jgi:hypothetical protein
MQRNEYHTLEILDKITRHPTLTDLKLISAHYNLGGLTAVVEDVYNKQKYTINITPVREEANS